MNRLLGALSRTSRVPSSLPLSGALPLVLLGALALGAPARALAQGAQGDAAPDSTAPAPEDELDRLLRLAREGAPVVRPQAAEELTRLGAPAAERVLAEAGDDAAGLARLGRDLVAALGRLDDERLRARLWSALADPDFPWRPQAAQTLAETAREPEAPRLVALADDPLAAVRAQAIIGLARLGQAEHRPLLEARLSDPDDRVRRVAAVALDSMGEHWALAWLIEDLRRDDRFFQMRTGMTARFDAARLLSERLGSDLGLKPGADPDDEASLAALARLEERVRELAGGELPELPSVARASDVEIDALIGVEVRSCRRGEHFLRWTADDALWVGTGNAMRIDLPPGTGARLADAAAALAEELGPRGAWGEPGCDLEQLHLALGTSRVTSAPTPTYRVSKGPDPEPDLRPAALGRLLALLVATIPDDASAPGAPDLRETVTGALESVGGELPPPDASLQQG